MKNRGPGDCEVQKGDGGGDGCAVCAELLSSLGRFFEMLQGARSCPESEWLTVGQVAEELKISTSIVYRLIRNGELEAVNIVDSNGRIAQRGHYRIKRSCLDRYLDVKKVRPTSCQIPRPPKVRPFAKVKNHLGL